MSARALLQRRRAFISGQQSGRDFLLQLRPFLEVLGRDPQIRGQLDALAREAGAQRAAIASYDSEAVLRLVALGNDIRTAFPSPDPPTPAEEPLRPWYWASFDRTATQGLELKDFELPEELSDPTVAGKLLPFLRGKLRDIANTVVRTGDETQLERSAPLWDRFNEEDRQHQYAVRNLQIQQGSHAGWSLRRIEHVAGLLNRRTSPEELEASGGLDFTPWEPISRAVNYVVFAITPDPPLHTDDDTESAALLATLRVDVDRVCEELDLRLPDVSPPHEGSSGEIHRLDDGVLDRVIGALWVLECEEHTVQGTAFALADGRVVTCEHVVCEHVIGERSPCTKMMAFRATDTQKRHPVRVVHSNRDVDLAVIDLGTTDDAGLHAAGTQDLAQTDRLWVAGFPNYRLGDSGSVAPGVVTAFRTVSAIRRILTDALIIAGNSGGPGITRDGKVIGVAVTGADCSEASRTTENYGLIPIDALRHLT